MPSLTPAKGAAEMPSIITVRLSAIGCSVGIAVASNASVITIASVPAVVAVGSDTAVIAVASNTPVVAVASVNAVIGVMPMHTVGDSMSGNRAVNVTSFGYGNRAH
jgi:hypothetical protein